jgi:Rhodopirellula transposase DDE domain
MALSHDSGWAGMCRTRALSADGRCCERTESPAVCRLGSASIGSPRRQFDGAGQRMARSTIYRRLVGHCAIGFRPRPDMCANIPDPIDSKLSRAVPYAIYDITNTVGSVSVGTDHDTAAFAVNAIRRWWRTMGRKHHPKAERLIISADGGGSDGYRVRQWKVEHQKIADEIKLPIAVCHLPPVTGKCNKIEHRLFSSIIINWRGETPRGYRKIVQLIAAATTDTGLKARAEFNKKGHQGFPRRGSLQPLTPRIPSRLELHGFTSRQNPRANTH